MQSLQEIRCKFAGCTWSDAQNVWPLGDLIFAAERKPVVNVPLQNLQESLESTDTDELLGSEEFQRRAATVDLRYPVILLERSGKLEIVDGVHRIWKARAMGLTVIQARVLQVQDLEKLDPGEGFEPP